MSNRIRQAFDCVHATQQMKQTNCAFVHDQLAKSRPKRPSLLGYAAACCAVVALMLCGGAGYGFYFTPVSYISVDVNPSIEFSLNRLDRVVEAAAFQEEGAEILKNLQLKNKTYIQAIQLLLADDTFAYYLTQDALLSFTVVSDREEELLQGIAQCHSGAQVDVECHSADKQLVEAAHHNGLSVGKYQAYLLLSWYDKTITVDDCKSLSMGQIRALIRQYQMDGDGIGAGGPGGGWGSGHHGTGPGGGHGDGYGYRGGAGDGLD